MRWQTKEEVQKAAKGTLLDALECSREHHQQGAECGYEELISLVAGGNAADHTTAAYCPLCVRGGWTEKAKRINCKGCPLVSCNKETDPWGLFDETYDAFSHDRSRSNFEAFQAAERKMVAKLDELIAEEKAKTEKPKLRHGDVYVKGGRITTVSLRGGKYTLTHTDGSVNEDIDAKITRLFLAEYDFSHNLVDDLEALKEDVDDYEISCNRLSSDKFRAYVWRDDIVILDNRNGDDIHLDSEHLATLILKLRQMEATLKRRQK